MALNAPQMGYTGNNLQTAYEFFIQNGLSAGAAAGIIGNLMQESGVNPESQQQGGPGRGIAQWSEGGRWQPSLMTGNVARDLIAQLNYIWWELNTDYKGTLNALRATNNADQAAAAFEQTYEMAAGGGDTPRRQQNANSVISMAQSGQWGGNPQLAATGGAPTGGTSVAPTTQVDSSGGNVPAPPGVGDIPALVEYIKQYFGADAWLLNTSPQVAQVVEDAVAKGYGNDQGYITAQIQNTTWFRTTSTAYRTYLSQVSTDPADYSFAVPGSTASQKLADVKAQAATQGVSIAENTAQALAMNALKYGWTPAQINESLGDLVWIHQNKANQITTNAGAVLSQLQQANGQYLQNPNDPTLQSWAENIAGGTQTIAQYDAYLKQNASLKWTGMAPQIAQGYTPQQITSNLQSNAAQTMGVDPAQVNFATDPIYQKVLDYAPPGEPGKPAPGHRMMTLSEMNQYLKGLPQWADTAPARDDVGQLVNQIATTFGKAP